MSKANKYKEDIMKFIKKFLSLSLLIPMCMLNFVPSFAANSGESSFSEKFLKFSNIVTERTSKVNKTSETLQNEQKNTASQAMYDFAVKSLQKEYKNENTLLSPLSIISALGMTCNGAKGETLSQMEKTLGFKTDELNKYISAYKNSDKEDLPKVFSANSVWVNKNTDFKSKKEFEDKIKKYYKGEIETLAFNNTAKNKINKWVDKNTSGMIEEIINDISPNAIMYLINALSFDAKWESEYEKSDVRKDKFTEETGKKIDVDMMHSDESYYISGKNETGAIKYYKGGQYAFVTLLPKKAGIKTYLDTLNGKYLSNLIKNAENTDVILALPKFKAEYGTELGATLKSMGMKNAFDKDLADFHNMGTWKEGNVLISKVLHKTFIEVSEQGTKAAAATAVIMEKCTAMPIFKEPKEVILDRPFVYMIVDMQNQIPLFIGTEMTVK